MTQMQIEQLNQQEYCHLLSYGEPIDTNMYDLDHLDENDSQTEWISTLDSMTYPGLTFGYSVAPYMYTSL